MIRVPIGYKFIFGFIAVVAAVAFVPHFINRLDTPEWLRDPLSFTIAMVIGLILGTIFTKSFTRRFNHLIETAKRISFGDIRPFNNPGASLAILSDETSDLEDALTLVVTNLRGLVQHIKDTVINISEAQTSLNMIIQRGQETSRDVIAGTGKIFDGAFEQARHVEDTSSMVKEVAGMADDVAIKVTDAANASQKVSSMVERGANTATGAIEKLEGIFRGIDKTESVATRLKEKLSDIPKILDVITHISRQIDLLALNATIEASKAGEHGKGFAMVAEEVRRFADNTTRSVDEITQIVKELKVEVERMVAAASEGSSSIKEGRDDIRKIREILGDITNYTTEVAEKSILILSLTQKQKEKADKTVSTIEQVAYIAKENLATTERVDSAVDRHGSAIEEIAASSGKLSELAKELEGVVARFKLE